MPANARARFVGDVIAAAIGPKVVPPGLATSRGTLLRSTHEPADAAAADWVLLLAGRVVVAGPPDEVLVPARLSEAHGANALHMGIDTAVHLVALGGVWLATRPADPRHPYGYERYEALASLLIGMLLLVAMGVIVSSALPRLADPKPGAATGVGLAIMAVSAVSTGGLALYLRRKARQTQSRVLGSEAIHAAADALISVGVLGAVGVAAAGFPRLDPIMALGVAGVVAWRGWLVARRAADTLMRFIVPAVAGPARLVSLAALATPELSARALRAAAERGRLRAQRDTRGQWRSSQRWADEYRRGRYRRVQ